MESQDQEKKSNVTLNEENYLLEKILLKNEYTKIIEVLSESVKNCFINILGETKFSKEEDPKKFILKISKKEFDFIALPPPEKKDKESNNINNTNNDFSSSEYLQIIQKISTIPKQYFKNDIYTKYLTIDMIQNKVNIELIYPANQKQIDKYKCVFLELISETYDLYLSKTLPYIQSIPKKDLNWIYNIFEKNTETPIGKSSSGNFYIMKNYTAINSDKNFSYLGLPIPSFDYIKCIRNLSKKELPLLEEFYNEGRKILAEATGCKKNEIKTFVHYPPSFYYFHVHYRHVNDFDDESSRINRAIDLGEVIQNIKLVEDYYQKVAIDHEIQVGSKLYKLFFPDS